MSAVSSIEEDRGTESEIYPNVVQALCEKSQLPKNDVEKVLVNLSSCILSQEHPSDIKSFLSNKQESLTTYDLDSAVSAFTNLPRPTVVAVTQGLMQVIELILRPENNFCGQKVILGNAIEIESNTKSSRSVAAKDNGNYLSVKVSTTSQFKKKMR